MAESARLTSLREKYKLNPNAPTAAHHLAAALLGETEGSHCLDELAAYVDDEIAGIPVAQSRPDLKRHLDLCASCSALYLELLQSGLDELREFQSQPTDILKPDLSFLPSTPPLSQIAQQVAERILARLAPRQVPNLERLAGPFFQRLSAVGGALDLERAYKPTLSGEPIEAFQVLVFAYFTSLTLNAQSAGPATEPDWDRVVANAAQSVGRRMRISDSVAAALTQAYALEAAEWQAILRKSR